MKMENKYTELIGKICLGTAQFGMDYGIANKTGKPDTDEINNILNFALASRIVSLDTAHSYGSSEEAIGEFIENNSFYFKIISKLPQLKENADIEEIVFESLSRLNISNIYGYLIHRFDDFLKYPSLWEHLEDLKQKKIIQKIGFSIYTPHELEIIFKKNIDCDIIQIPYNVFDRRFENYLPELKEKKIEVYSRSVFLQGLVFLRKEELSGNLIKAKDKIEKLNKVSIENDIPINKICFNFALLNPYIDKVIIGVDTFRHLREDIDSLSSIDKVNSIYDKLAELSIEDEDIILPCKWTKG